MTESSVERLRNWFYPQAQIMSFYGGGEVVEEEQTKSFKKHVRRCKLVWVTEPRVGHITVYGGDDNTSGDQVLGIVAMVGCKCGRYATDYKLTELFIPGALLLRELIEEARGS